MKVDPNDHEFRPWMTGREFHLVTTQPEFDDMVDRCLASGRIGFDTEGSGLHPTRDRICGFCVAPDPSHGYYIPIRHEKGANFEFDKAIEGMNALLHNDHIEKVYMHHAQFDINMLWNDKIDFRRWRNLGDTMIAYWLDDSSRKGLGLKKVASQFLQVQMLELWEVLGFTKKPPKFDPRVYTYDPLRVTVYGSSDAMCTFWIHDRLEKEGQFFKQQKSIYLLEMATLLCLTDMDRNPILTDQEYVMGHKIRLESLIAETERKVHDIAGYVFNLGSNDQIATLLFDQLNLPVIKMTSEKQSAKRSTDDEVLETLGDKHPIVPLLQDWRGYTKLLSTYLVPFFRDHENGETRISYFQPATETGRVQGRKGNFDADGRVGMSISTAPKIKNPAPDIYNPRRVIIARKGRLYASIDYANEEMRIAANMSGEEAWIEALLAGRNLHREMACRMYNKVYDAPEGDPQAVTPSEYGGAKGMNFRYLYGGGSPKEEGYNAYYAAVPKLKGWQDYQRKHMRDHGWVQTAWGRIRQAVELVQSRDRGKIAYAERQAVNSPVQGSGSDILRLALTQIWLGKVKREFPELEGNLFPRLLVHDEIGFEIAYEPGYKYGCNGEGTLSREAIEKGWTFERILYMVCEVMESITLPSWKVPLLVDGHFGPYWAAEGDFHDFDLDRERKQVLVKERKSPKKEPKTEEELLASFGLSFKAEVRDGRLVLSLSPGDKWRTRLVLERFRFLLTSCLDIAEGGPDSGPLVLSFQDGGEHRIEQHYRWNHIVQGLQEVARQEG